VSDYAVAVLSRIGIESFVALSTYLLLLMGRVSFGQQAFFALGGYGAGIATALYGAPLWLGLLIGTALATAGGSLMGVVLAPASGLTFAVGSLAFAELVRFGLLQLTFQRPVAGELLGPVGAQGFRGIRLVYLGGLGPLGFFTVIAALLAGSFAVFLWFERSPTSAVVRMIGEDRMVAAVVGVPVNRVIHVGLAAAAALAGLGGALFAHWTTYVEPGHAEVMLGVHSLAYPLIGGLGTPVGPLLGVALDIGLLESFRPLEAYRMLVFGGLVITFLIVRPRGVLDEQAVHILVDRLRRLITRRRAHLPP